ncbi:hypothetical protein ACO0LM_27615 [Undibacterium sp. Di26W]|uniref:hypothetical protein n=1 Tax=Undibacterium sp. Di26W TaxID=3413035 RepID=UPI003BF319FB
MKFLLGLNWIKSLGLSIAVFVLYRILSKNFANFKEYRDIVLCVIALFLIIRFLAETPQGLERFRVAKGNKRGLGTLFMAFLPNEISAFLRFQSTLLVSFFSWLKGKKYSPEIQEGIKIEIAKKSEYGTIFIIGMLCLFVDIPICVLIASVQVPDPHQRAIIHIVVLSLSAYILMLGLGDRWKMKGSFHLLTDAMLHLRVADRVLVDIYVESISKAEFFSQDIEKWSKETKGSSDNYLIVRPCINFDKPNLLVQVDIDSKSKTLVRCVDRKTPSYFLIYVDDPNTAINLINAKLKSRSLIPRAC